jgi:plasmid stabilization system protein ParE
MRLIIHPLIQKDIRYALDYYDHRSDRAGDRFFAEVAKALDRIETAPLSFHPIDHRRRRCNLPGFPYHLVFEVREELIGVMVLRHDRRKPSFGLTRKW